MTDIQKELGVHFLGDPHLGRVFKAGVPLDRLGEREEEQMRMFEADLAQPKYSTHVCLGDLFDKFRVSNEVVLRAATAYEAAALSNPEVNYYILQGNHDNAKDDSKVSSFAIFQRMVAYLTNVHVLTGTTELISTSTGKAVALIPWHPNKTAKEAITELTGFAVDAICAHWDTNDYGDDEAEYVIPVKETAERTKCVVLGHYHKPSIREFGVTNTALNLKVYCWGSMQPYAHGEDPLDELYITQGKSQVELNLLEDENWYHDKCLRVLLVDGEDPVAGVNCRQLTHKRVKSTDNPNELEDVSVEEFNLATVLKRVFNRHYVSNDLTNEVLKRI